MKLPLFLSDKKFVMRSVIFIASIGVLTAAIIYTTTKPTYSKPEQQFETKISISPKQKKVQITEHIVTNDTAIVAKKVIPTDTTTIGIAASTATPAPQPTATPVPPTQAPADTEPPRSNVLYPGQGGEITYKIDGQVCAINYGSTDNQSSHNEISIAYKFDTDGWSEFLFNKTYICKETLPNGPHTLSFQSKDSAGNVEQEQVVSFTVNIENN